MLGRKKCKISSLATIGIETDQRTGRNAIQKVHQWSTFSEHLRSYGSTQMIRSMLFEIKLNNEIKKARSRGTTLSRLYKANVDGRKYQLLYYSITRFRFVGRYLGLYCFERKISIPFKVRYLTIKEKLQDWVLKSHNSGFMDRFKDEKVI